MILEYIKKYEKRSILTSIIMILIAILLIIKPVAMLDTFVTIFGIGILLDGIFSIILYIITDREQKIYSRRRYKIWKRSKGRNKNKYKCYIGLKCFKIKNCKYSKES